EAPGAEGRSPLRTHDRCGHAAGRARAYDRGSRGNRVQTAVVGRVPQRLRRHRQADRCDRPAVGLEDRASIGRVRVRLDRRTRPGARRSRRGRAHTRLRADRAGVRRAAACGDLSLPRRRASGVLHLRLQARCVLAVRAPREGDTRQRDRARAEGEARAGAPDRAGPHAVAGTLRRAGLIASLPALVGASTLVHWLAGRRLHGLWIMPDEAVYAQRAIGVWRHFSLPILHGQGAGYSVLYPVVAGLPFATGGLHRGYESLKLLQALVASLAAVPVFFYGRRLMPNGYALIAAALTVASPLLLYSGLVMTEVLAYPVAAVATLAITRAVATARRRDQALALIAIAAAVSTRVQSVVLLAAFAAAILVDGIFARAQRKPLRFWPVWALLVLAGIAVLFRPDVLGAYSSTISGGYPVGEAARLAYDHLAYLFLSIGIAPAVALLIMLVPAARGREPDPSVRALLAVTLCTTVLVVAQVGLFAARFAPHLLGRDLSPIPPLLCLVFAVWLARGCPRPLLTASAAVAAVAAIVIAAPWNTLVVDTALPDTMDIALFLRTSAKPESEIAIGVAIAVLLVRFVPRRARLVLPALVLAF